MSSLLHISALKDAAFSSSPWNGVSVVRHRFAGKKVRDWQLGHYTIDINIGSCFHLESKRNGGYRQNFMAPNSLAIRPAHEATTLSWSESIEVVTVRLEPWMLLYIADESKVRGPLEIPERYGDTDAQIAYICRALWAEQDAGYPSGRVFGESLATALAASLVQRYSVRPGTKEIKSGLSPRNWKQVRDFIEENLESDIALDDMARVAGLSPYYFARCFKVTAGTSPHQYLIARRIERARQLLTSSTMPLPQVAAQCGFSDQSHLTRHMKRLLGVTPRALIERGNLA